MVSGVQYGVALTRIITKLVFNHTSQDEVCDQIQVLASQLESQTGYRSIQLNGLEKIWVAPSVWPTAFFGLFGPYTHIRVFFVWLTAVFGSVWSAQNQISFCLAGRYPYSRPRRLANRKASAKV